MNLSQLRWIGAVGGLMVVIALIGIIWSSWPSSPPPANATDTPSPATQEPAAKMAERKPRVWNIWAPIAGWSEPFEIETSVWTDFCIYPKGKVRGQYVTYASDGAVAKRGEFDAGPGPHDVPNLGKLEGRTEFRYRSKSDAAVEVRGKEDCFGDRSLGS